MADRPQTTEGQALADVIVSAIKAAAPKWHDKPPVPGDYVTRSNDEPASMRGLHSVRDPDREARMWLHLRWFGPIPPDPQKETGK